MKDLFVFAAGLLLTEKGIRFYEGFEFVVVFRVLSAFCIMANISLLCACGKIICSCPVEVY